MLSKKIYIKCDKKGHHKDYKTTCDIFVRGSRCPYCSGRNLSIEDSFGRYFENNIDNNFIQKYWSKTNTINPYELSCGNSKISFYLKCQNNVKHVYKTNAPNFIKGNRCPYCKSFSDKVIKEESLGALHPEIIDIWSDKNEKTPFEYREKSHKKIWLKCFNNKHVDFLKTISDYTCNNAKECPSCVIERKESILEEKVRIFLEDLKKYTILHEYNCTLIPINPKTKCKLPYDNEIKELKLIIEVNGKQHYELGGWHITQSKNTKRTPKEEFDYSLWRDLFKKDYVLKNNYNYLEIPYWEDDEEETYKKSIINKINELTY